MKNGALNHTMHFDIIVLECGLGLAGNVALVVQKQVIKPS
jgi:hypothetical protein